MNRIFTGMLWIFLDFNWDLGDITIGLIPDFIGYIIIVKGLVEMSKFSDRFDKVKYGTVGMAIYTSFVYAMDLFGIWKVFVGIMPLVVGMVSSIVSFWISYNIVMGIREIEDDRCVDLNSEVLYRDWKQVLAFTVFSYAFIIIPILAVVSIIIVFIISILFLVELNKSKNLFYKRVY